jgi:beta-glucosidase
MPPSDFADVNIDEILDKLSTEDAVKLIAGVGLWHTASIERLGIPAIKVRLLLRRHHVHLSN